MVPSPTEVLVPTQLGIYKVRPYGSDPHALAAWRQEIEELKAAGKAEAPNSMNKYGDDIRALVNLYVKPFAEKADIDLDVEATYPFVVEYSTKTQRSLATHVDAADVTLNLCLYGKFTGGELVFPDAKSGARALVLKQRPGVAIVHSGKAAHRAAALKSGTRTNLVLWCFKRGCTRDSRKAR